MASYLHLLVVRVGGLRQVRPVGLSRAKLVGLVLLQ